MAWCGLVWCGMVVWYGMIWCGVVWCGVVRYGVVRCGVVRYGGWYIGYFIDIICFIQYFFDKSENKLLRTYICGLTTEDNKDLDAYLESGMDDFLTKPANPKSLSTFLIKLEFQLNPTPTPPLALPPLSSSLLTEGGKRMEDGGKKEGGGKKGRRSWGLKPGITLLAVDDNDFILMGISHLKLTMKNKIEVCRSGQQALAKFEAMLTSGWVYHFLLIDIDMPILSGLDLTRQIRQRELSLHLPRTHIVGLINDDYKDIESYLEAGMDEFINKPVNPKLMSGLVENRMKEVSFYIG